MERVFKLQMVSQFSSLLQKNNETLTAFSYDPEFSGGKCYWSMRLHENHKSHMVFWKEFLVEVDGDKIFEKDVAADSLKEVK